MNAIMGFSSLLGEDIIDESEKTQYIEIIKNSSNRLLQLINDIIDLSKLESKQLTLSNSECSLSDIFTNSIKSFRKSELLLKKPEIELELQFPAACNKIRCLTDGIRVQQVLDNLISNAIKYSDKGKVVTGCSIISENNRDYIEFYVKDTGIGISEEMTNLVFERFRQVEEGRFHEGAGLGLSISKGIIDILGGKIWFQSKINEGSTFYFTIPYVITANRQLKSEKPSAVLTQLAGKNVIIAEDDYNSYRYLELVLGGQNANIMHAENGKILLDMVREKLPHLILLDINMPIMSGFEFLSEMRNAGLKTKIIAQTAYAMPDEKEKCLDEGCDGYIAKPIKKSELFMIINRVLSDK